MTIEGRIDKHIAGFEIQATGIGKLLERACKHDRGVSVQVPMSRHILDGRQMIQSEPNLPLNDIRFHLDHSNPINRRAERTPRSKAIIEILAAICQRVHTKD
jgi:hypothetical protein